MQRADQWLTGDFLDDVAVYPEPERFGHLIILELIGQHDQMRIRKPLLQFAAIVCSEMVRPIVYDDDVTALLFRTSQWSVQLARILDGGGYSEIGRAHVSPVTNAHLVSRLLLAKKYEKHTKYNLLN